MCVCVCVCNLESNNTQIQFGIHWLQPHVTSPEYYTWQITLGRVFRATPPRVYWKDFSLLNGWADQLINTFNWYNSGAFPGGWGNVCLCKGSGVMVDVECLETLICDKSGWN